MCLVHLDNLYTVNSFCNLFKVFDFVKCISLVNNLKSGDPVRKCKHGQRTRTA